MSLMRIRSLFFATTVVASMIILATTSRAQFNSDSCGCPIPLGDTGLGFGIRLPEYYDGATAYYPMISPGGSKLIYVTSDGGAGAYILDLQTHQRTQILVDSSMPREVDDGWSMPIWCPYDTDLVLFALTSEIDTSDNPAYYVTVGNDYLYRISTGQSQRITPPFLGPYGSGGYTGIEGSLGPWTPGSQPGNDTFTFGYTIPNHRVGDSIFYGLYIPQTQKQIPFQLNSMGQYPPDTVTMAFSRDGKHTLKYFHDTTVSSGPQPGDTLILDGKAISYPLDFFQPAHAGFSPDGKQFALSVDPMIYNDTGDSINYFSQIWIYNTENPDPDSVKVINLQCCFCTYGFTGIDAEFVTDSTLAVSMMHDGDESSPLWEISIEGCNIVRQLTFLPEYQNGVAGNVSANSGSSIHIYPNPFSQSTEITFTSQAAGYAEVSIVNMLGVEVARLFSGELGAGEHSFVWDAGKNAYATQGTYECLVRMNGQVETLPVVLMR